jgi:methyl-accepting chemotaxis protein
MALVDLSKQGMAQVYIHFKESTICLRNGDSFYSEEVIKEFPQYFKEFKEFNEKVNTSLFDINEYLFDNSSNLEVVAEVTEEVAEEVAEVAEVAEEVVEEVVEEVTEEVVEEVVEVTEEKVKKTRTKKN